MNSLELLNLTLHFLIIYRLIFESSDNHTATMARPSITLYLDVVSPFAYIAYHLARVRFASLSSDLPAKQTPTERSSLQSMRHHLRPNLSRRCDEGIPGSCQRLHVVCTQSAKRSASSIATTRHPSRSRIRTNGSTWSVCAGPSSSLSQWLRACLAISRL